MGRIKVLFRALKIARPEEAIDLIERRFRDFVIFTKDICLVMEVLEEETPGCFDELADEVVETTISSPASSIQLIRTWLLEFFVRGVIGIQPRKLKRLEALRTVTDQRQLLLIRGRCNDKNYFRKRKTAINHFAMIELPSLVWGASCLPYDEYEAWLHTVKVKFDGPLGGLFLQWAARNKSDLVSKLKAPVVDHPE